MLESLQNLGRLISEFKETNLAESSKIDNKLGLFCLFFSPFCAFGISLHFFTLVWSSVQPEGFFYVVCSPGYTHYPLCPCSQSP